MVALLLAACVALSTVVFLSLVNSLPAYVLLLAGGIAFGSSFLLIFVTLEFLIFREVEKIYSAIDKINRKEFKLYTADVERSGNPFRRMNQEIVAYAARKQKEVNDLKRMENFRREFIADISHELKTPIFAAQGFILTLLDGAMEDENVRYKFLKKAAKSLEGLSLLVQDLLTLSQIESGAIVMNPENFDIHQLALDVFEQLEEKAAKKEISFKTEGNFVREEGVYVFADYTRMLQVMTNLINNAIKYGNENGHVVVQFFEEDEQVSVLVIDDGPGIPKEDLRRIFERFYRVEKSRSRKQGGSGLGLAIVKHILDKHDSDISVSSELNKGTTFHFRLPKGVAE
jgi:two-component system phosphate regulon sensor histidine kinase PhoR